MGKGMVLHMFGKLKLIPIPEHTCDALSQVYLYPFHALSTWPSSRYFSSSFLPFEYKPSNSFAPIHEITTRNTHIKEFYWKLWFGDDAVFPGVNIQETFVMPEIAIEADAVERFCVAVGNQGESFKTVWSDDVKVPMDFTIVTG
jgi:enoyl reductase-like protein